ncbi:hypothetical protein [Chryseolinea lacunae]|uniref:Uncharacterized protein n=1 Tax=Chryseolinea lacunae TaxID=2801331 RepID=A0ABS1KNX7_9BACT|nr:hypothetical protein [Chryseolinea lacunae]MBL0741136.1 hypothetical protein [Chryseolinea lacunae]
MTVFKIKQVHETVATLYQELFKIRFEHLGYETPDENFLSKGLSIAPDTRTEDLFRNYHLDYRFDAGVLTCFIHCNLFNPPNAEPKIPFVTVPADLWIRFLVKASDDFSMKTYVVAAGSKQTYAFTNQINNTSGGNLFLSRGVETYVAAGDYAPGAVVSNGGQLFAALKPVLGSAGISIGNAAFWKSLQPLEQVVSKADLFDNAVVNAERECFAVIDLFRSGTVNASYRLFDVDKLFHPAPVFTLKFIKRP